MAAHPGAQTLGVRTGQGLGAWARLHPVVAYVLLTYAISWGCCLLAPALAPADANIRRQIAMLAAFGPALAAAAMSALHRSGPASASRRSRIVVFAIVIVAGCLAWDLLYRFLPESGMRPGLWWLDVLSAAVAAFLIAGRLSAPRGSQGVPGPAYWRRVLPWCLLVILFWPLLVVLERVVAPLLGLGPWPASPLLIDAAAWPRYLLLVAVTLLYGGGLEEPGWRGFALPQLQKRSSPLVATVIVGLMWAVWHGPIYYGVSLGAVIAILPMALSTTAMGFLYTWIYNGSRGSLVPVVLLHAISNTVGDPFLPSGPVPRVGAALIGILLVFAARMWRKVEVRRL